MNWKNAKRKFIIIFNLKYSMCIYSKLANFIINKFTGTNVWHDTSEQFSTRISSSDTYVCVCEWERERDHKEFASCSYNRGTGTGASRLNYCCRRFFTHEPLSQTHTHGGKRHPADKMRGKKVDTNIFYSIFYFYGCEIILLYAHNWYWCKTTFFIHLIFFFLTFYFLVEMFFNYIKLRQIFVFHIL